MTASGSSSTFALRAGGFSLFTILLFLVATSLTVTVLAAQIDKYLRTGLGERVGAEMADLHHVIAPFISHFSPSIQSTLTGKQSYIDISNFRANMLIGVTRNADGIVDLPIESIQTIHALYRLPGHATRYDASKYNVRLSLSSITKPGRCDPNASPKGACFVEALIYRKEGLYHNDSVDTFATQAALKRMGSGGGITLPDAPGEKARFVRFGPNDGAAHRISNPISGDPEGILVISSFRSSQHQPYFLRSGDEMHADLHMDDNNIKNAGIMTLKSAGNVKPDTILDGHGIQSDKPVSITAETVRIGRDGKQVIIKGDDIDADASVADRYDRLRKIVLTNRGLAPACDDTQRGTLRVNEGALYLCANRKWERVKGKDGKSVGSEHMGKKGPQGHSGLPGRGLRPTIRYGHQRYTQSHRIGFGIGEVELDPAKGYSGPGALIQCSVLEHDLNWRVQLMDDGLSWKVTTARHLFNETRVKTICNYMTINVNGKDVTSGLLHKAIFR